MSAEDLELEKGPETRIVIVERGITGTVGIEVGNGTIATEVETGTPGSTRNGTGPRSIIASTNIAVPDHWSMSTSAADMTRKRLKSTRSVGNTNMNGNSSRRNDDE